MEEKIKHYHSLMKKYLGWEFIDDNVDDETEYLNHYATSLMNLKLILRTK